MKRIRIFLSSPGDVGSEREKAREIFERLQLEFSGRLEIAPYFWEHEPMRAHTDFQSQIESPSRFDLFVCLLWSRLGSRLHPGLHRKKDGEEYASGTEFEVLDALEGFHRSGAPEILIYKRTGDPVIPPKPKEVRERILIQYDALESFLSKLGQEDGCFVMGMNRYHGLEQFEVKFENDMRKVLQRHAPAGATGAPALATSWKAGSPFRGLRTFEFEHAAIFFGRTRAVDEVLAALRQQAAQERAFVLVFGGSGVGKSSLVRAGVLPWLVKPGVIDGVGLWRRATLRPGEAKDGDLFDALAAALLRPEGLPEIASDGTAVGDLARMFRDQPGGAGMLIKGALSQAAREVQLAEKLEKQPRALCVLTIDQFEELFTDDRLVGQREGFFRAVDVLARSGFVWVLATLRSDFYARCEESPLLMELKSSAGQYHLRPPDEAQLGQMIRLPAAAAGLVFEEDPKSGERLDDLLRDAAVKNPAALPLLEFTLEELYEQRGPGGNVLRLETYRALGGVAGALGRRAEESYQRGGERAQASFDRVFRRLVTIGATEGAPAVRRRARQVEFEGIDGALEMLALWTEDRLLVADRTDEGDVVIAIAHEAMLGSWPRLARWVEENRERLTIRAQVSVDAGRWGSSGKNPDYLYAGGLPLEKATEALAAGYLDESERTFVEASRHRIEETAHRRVRRLKQVAAGFAVLALAAVGVGVIAVQKQHEARVAAERAEMATHQAEAARRRAEGATQQEQASRRVAEEATHREAGARREAEEAGRQATASKQAARDALANSLEESGARYLTEKDDPERALVYLNRAFQIDPRRPSLNFLLARAMAPFAAGEGVFGAHRDAILECVVSPDGRYLATAGGDAVACLWQTDNQRLLHRLSGHGAGVCSIAFSADSAKLLTGSRDGSVRLWHCESGEEAASLDAHRGSVVLLRFLKGGQRFLSAGEDGWVLLWEIGKQKPIREIRVAPGAVNQATLAADESVLAAVTWEGKALECDLGTGESRTLAADAPVHGVMTRATFNADHSLVTAGAGDGRAFIWQASDAKLVATLRPESASGAVVAVSFRPGGRELLTATADGKVTLWDSVSGKPVLKWEAAPLSGAEWTVDGAAILIAGEDGEIRAFDPQSGSALARFHGHRAAVTSLALSPDGEHVASGAKDGDARWWSLSAARIPALLGGHAAPITTLSATHDGARLLTTSEDGTARLLDPRKREPVGQPLSHGDKWVLSGGFSADGKKVFTLSSDRVSLWTADGAALASPGGNPLSPVQTWKGKPFGDSSNRFSAAAFMPAGDELVVASELKGRDIVTPGRAIWQRLRLDTGKVAAESDENHPIRGFLSVGNAWLCALESSAVSAWKSDAATFFGWVGAGGVSSATVSADGSQIAAGHSNGQVTVSDVNDWEIASFAMTDGSRVEAVAFDADARLLAAGGTSGRICVWQMSDGHLLSSVDTSQKGIRHLQFHPGNPWLAVGGAQGLVELWDASRGRVLAALRGHRAAISGLAFLDRGDTLATSGRDGVVRLWDLRAQGEKATGEQSARIDRLIPYHFEEGQLAPGSQAAANFAWQADGRPLFKPAEEARAEALQQAGFLAERARRAALSGDVASALHLADDAQSNGLASPGFAAFARALLATTGGVQWRCRPCGSSIYGLSLSGDERLWVAGSMKEAVIGEVATGRRVAVLGQGNETVSPPIFSPDSSLVGAIAGRTRVQVWDAATGRVRFTLDPQGIREAEVRRQALARENGDKPQLLAFDFSGDSRQIYVAGADGIVRAWSTVDGQYLHSFGPHPGNPRTIVTDKHSSRFLVACDEGTIALWDAQKQTLIRREKNFTKFVSSAAFTEDGKYAVSCAYDGWIQVQDAAGGQVLGRTNIGLWANRISFAPDGRSLIATSDHPRLLDLPALKPMHQWSGFVGTDYGLHVSPKGDTVAESGTAGGIQINELPSGRLLRYLRRQPVNMPGVRYLKDGRLLSWGDDVVQLLELSQLPPSGRFAAPDATLAQGNLTLTTAGLAVLSVEDGEVSWRRETAKDVQTKVRPEPAWFGGYGRKSLRGVTLHACTFEGSAKEDEKGQPLPLDPVAKSVTSKVREALSQFPGLKIAFSDGSEKPVEGAFDATLKLELRRKVEVHAPPIRYEVTAQLVDERDSYTLLFRNVEFVAGDEAACVREIAAAVRSGNRPVAALDPNAQFLLTGTAGGQLALWSATTGAPGFTLPPTGSAVTSVGFAPGAKTAWAVDASETVTILSIPEGRTLGQYSRLHGERITALSIDPTGRRLLTGSADGTARVTSLPDGKWLAHLAGQSGRLEGLEWSANGTLILTAARGEEPSLWNAADGTRYATLAGMNVEAAHFSPDGRFVAGFDRHGNLGIWEAVTAKLIYSGLQPHSGCRFLAWRADGQSVITVGTDGAVAEEPFSSAPLSADESRRFHGFADRFAVPPKTESIVAQ